MDKKFSKLKETLKPDKFTDEEFPVKSEENNPWLKDEHGNPKRIVIDNKYVHTIDEISFERPNYGKFLKDSHRAEDILQEKTGFNFQGTFKSFMFLFSGDCWFLAAVAAVAERGDLIDRVIMPEFNETDSARELGLYRFRFFNLDWMDVFIDDVLAKGCVAEPFNDEYWVPLIQKAYTKFHGNYAKLTGGQAINGLYNLTGGVTLTVQKKDSDGQQNAYWSPEEANGFDLFEFMMENQKDAIYCSGNSETAKENAPKIIEGKMEQTDAHGLVSPHAYSIIQLAKIHLR